MGTITYDYTITNSLWFDSKPVMANYNKAKDEINGGLDENNLAAASDGSIQSLEIDNGFQTPLMDHTASVEVKLAEGKDFVIYDYLSAQLFKISEGEVTI